MSQCPENSNHYFYESADGYHFNVKIINPGSGDEKNMICSAMNYYSYLLMIQEKKNIYILRRRRLVYQYIVKHLCKNRNRTFDIHPVDSDQASH